MLVSEIEKKAERTRSTISDRTIVLTDRFSKKYLRVLLRRDSVSGPGWGASSRAVQNEIHDDPATEVSQHEHQEAA